MKAESKKEKIRKYMREYQRKLRKKPNYKEKVRRWAIARRKKFLVSLVSMKGGCCERCGYHGNLLALEFHRENGEEPKVTVSCTYDKYFEFQNIIEKCELLCSNCHKEIHYPEFNIKKGEIGKE